MEHQPLLELLAGRAFPELAAALRAGRDAIIAQWEAVCREVIPKADGLSGPQLRDDAPKVLDCVADALESDRPIQTEELAEATVEHGQVRYEQNFNIRELLIEYNLMRAVVIDQVTQRLGRPAELAEQIALNAGLDVMSRRSVQSFVEYQARELKAATEAQSKYLSFLSHDLRGGLNGVFLMIEVLRRELSNEPRLAETVQDLDVMRRSLLDTVATMDRFLNAERFRKGKVQLRPTTIRLKSMLEDTVAHFSYQAKDKGLELAIDVPRDCVVTSDRELLTIILQNLVSNAVKYTEKGGIKVTARPVAEGGCEISVIDQGPGIPPERMNGLFGEFTRGDTHGQPGVGLGLSIAHQAAEYLGARLWAESQPGHGSTFHVKLPPELPGK